MDSSSNPPDVSETNAPGDTAQNLLHATGDFLVGVKMQTDDMGSAPPAQTVAGDGAANDESMEGERADPAIVEPPDPGFVAPAE